MRIRILSQSVVTGNRLMARGDVVEMPECDAVPLIACKAAEEYVEGAEPLPERTPEPEAGAVQCDHPADRRVKAESMGNPHGWICLLCSHEGGKE